MGNILAFFCWGRQPLGELDASFKLTFQRHNDTTTQPPYFLADFQASSHRGTTDASEPGLSLP